MGAISNVVAFPVAAVRSTFDECWSALPDTMRKRSESRAKVRKLWDTHAVRVGGQDVLLGALKAYLRGDKDLPKSGGPGLQVFLRAERYDHWLGTSISGAIDGPSRTAFPDQKIRDAVLSALGEPFTISYLDSCVLIDGPLGPLLQPKTDYARKKLMEHAGLFKSLGLFGIRMER